MTRRRRAAAALVLATALAAAVVGARRLDPVPEGLRAQYFSNTEWRGEPVMSVVDREPSTQYLFEDWTGSPPSSFSTSWSGWLFVPRGGRYTFGTESDDASWVYIDGRLVVDSGAQPPPARARGTVKLESGVHSVFIRYYQNGGGLEFAFEWARADASLEPVPVWAMRPRPISYARFTTDRVLDTTATGAAVLWLLTLLGSAAIAFGPEVVRLKSRVIGSAWPALAGILIGSAALNIIGLGWGLPGGMWAGDELGPVDVLSALSQRFSRGWFDIYPPVQYYILGLAYSPALVLERLGLIDIHATFGNTLLMVIGRAVSVVMSTVTVLATFLFARRSFGCRAGLFASAMLALAAPFVYYSKTANVEAPYLMWFALALVFYLRVLAGAKSRDYVCWAAAVTLAICTKDQAYALCILMPPVVIYQTWRAHERAGVPHPFWRAVTDRRMGIAAFTAVVVFALAHNVIFNAEGFTAHVRFILGRKREFYRIVEPTILGRLSLLVLSARLVEQSWGWPLSVVSAGGVILALASAERRRVAVWLLVPIASYYLGFINVVLYNYDRFMLPVCLLLAPFGGLALDWVTRSSGQRRPWRLIGVAALFAYTLLYSGTVDVLMANDSRYAVEKWLTSHVRRNDLVGVSGLPRYLPRLERFRSVDIDGPETLAGAQPAVFVLNADYTRNEPPDSPLGRMIGMLRSGSGNYRLAFRMRSSNPWPWLPGGHPELVGSRLDPEVISFLRNINPEIEVFERIAPR